MASLTDGAIKHAINSVQKRRKQMMLSDGEGRGTGRLVLILKPMPTRVTAEWMAQQWRGARCRRAGDRIDEVVAAHLQEAAIVEASLADEDRLHRRLHVVVDAAPASALE